MLMVYVTPYGSPTLFLPLVKSLELIPQESELLLKVVLNKKMRLLTRPYFSIYVAIPEGIVPPFSLRV